MHGFLACGPQDLQNMTGRDKLACDAEMARIWGARTGGRVAWLDPRETGWGKLGRLRSVEM